MRPGLGKISVEFVQGRSCRAIADFRTLTCQGSFSGGCSGEEAVSHVGAAGGAGRNGERGRPDVTDVLVQRIVPGQAQLHGGVVLRLALEADEEQLGIEAALRVGAVDEVLAAAQHPSASILGGVSQAHVRARRSVGGRPAR